LNSFTTQQQIFAEPKRIDVFTMVHQISNYHIQAVINNLKLIIIDYVAAKKCGISDWRRDFCDWSCSYTLFGR